MFCVTAFTASMVVTEINGADETVVQPHTCNSCRERNPPAWNMEDVAWLEEIESRDQIASRFFICRHGYFPS
jgi:hypothetical protein